MVTSMIRIIIPALLFSILVGQSSPLDIGMVGARQLRMGGQLNTSHNPATLGYLVLDTGIDTQTGGRLKRLAKMIKGETFMMTYGDGVADVNIGELVDFHKTHGKLATVTAVRPPARFGSLTLDGSNVRGFAEKPQLGEGWINGGYFVFEPEIADYIGGDETFLEREPLENLARDGQLMAFKHSSFWQPMDTLRDLQTLRKRWDANDAPWRVWK